MLHYTASHWCSWNKCQNKINIWPAISYNCALATVVQASATSQHWKPPFGFWQPTTWSPFRKIYEKLLIKSDAYKLKPEVNTTTNQRSEMDSPVLSTIGTILPKLVIFMLMQLNALLILKLFSKCYNSVLWFKIFTTKQLSIYARFGRRYLILQKMWLFHS